VTHTNGRRGIGPEREVEGDWRRLHNEELHNLYASPNIIRVIKSGKRRWAVNVARTIEMKNSYKILVRKSEGRDNAEALGVDGRIILKLILENRL
jgi:hypothetical protein